MNLWIVVSLSLATIVAVALELSGRALVLNLKMKGDIKRESAFLAQYGQSVATPLAAWIVWCHSRMWQETLLVITPVAIASASCGLLKHVFGRVRPNRENAGRFTGPFIGHSNHRESFPSSHSACAFALSITLIRAYPQGAQVFWTLAIITAFLRYIMDAHWLGDIFGGTLLGYLIGTLTLGPLEHFFYSFGS